MKLRHILNRLTPMWLAVCIDWVQRRLYLWRIRRDHERWPLGTLVRILPRHHSPDAHGLIGKVSKHGYPCKDGTNCMVDFPHPVLDRTFGAERFAHYVDYKSMRKVRAVVDPHIVAAVQAQGRPFHE